MDRRLQGRPHKPITYVRTREQPWLLYDNQDDPFQKRNLIGKSDLAAQEKALEAELQYWLNKLGDEFLPSEAYIERDGGPTMLKPRRPLWDIKARGVIGEPL